MKILCQNHVFFTVNRNILLGLIIFYFDVDNIELNGVLFGNKQNFFPQSWEWQARTRAFALLIFVWDFCIIKLFGKNAAETIKTAVAKLSDICLQTEKAAINWHW